MFLVRGRTREEGDRDRKKVKSSQIRDCKRFEDIAYVHHIKRNVFLLSS